jgi:hypothetical protein
MATNSTVESPSVEFQRLRDYVDCLSCMELPEFARLKTNSSFSKEMEVAAKTQLKMSKVGTRKVNKYAWNYYFLTFRNKLIESSTF